MTMRAAYIEMRSAMRTSILQVVAIVVDAADIDVVGPVPVILPVFRPWVDGTEPIAVILETGMARLDTEWQAVDAEPMLRSEVPMVPVVRHAVAFVAATLIPSTMIGLPALRPMLLPGSLPGALLFLSVP